MNPEFSTTAPHGVAGLMSSSPCGDGSVRTCGYEQQAGVGKSVRNVVSEVISWQAQRKTRDIPSKHVVDDEERKLGIRFNKVLLRRFHALGAGVKPRDKQLTAGELALVSSVPGIMPKDSSNCKNDGSLRIGAVAGLMSSSPSGDGSVRTCGYEQKAGVATGTALSGIGKADQAQPARRIFAKVLDAP